MKKLLILAVVVTISMSVYAQGKEMKSGRTTFEVGANIGTGSKKGDKTTFGADLQVDIPASTKLKVTGSVGYQHFRYESGSGNLNYSDNTMILLAGLKTMMTTSLYVHAQAGYGINIDFWGGGGDFSYAASLGYLLSQNLNIALRYLSIGSLNAIMLRIALTLGANK